MARAKQVKQMAVTLPRKKRGRKRRVRAETGVSRLASGYTAMVRRRVECVPLFRLTERELRDLVAMGEVLLATPGLQRKPRWSRLYTLLTRWELVH